MSMLRFCLVLVAVLCALPGVATAQLKVNNIAVVDANQNPTGNTVVSQPGGSLTIRNDFNVDLIVQITDPVTGEVLAEETIQPGTETHNHGQSAGLYDIKVAVAVAPPAKPNFTDCGDLKVVAP